MKPDNQRCPLIRGGSRGSGSCGRVFQYAATVVLFLLYSCSPPPPAEDMLSEAVTYLWSQQAEDGGWHSPKHGILKEGQAHTAFILYMLLQVPEELYPRPQKQGRSGH